MIFYKYTHHQKQVVRALPSHSFRIAHLSQTDALAQPNRFQGGFYFRNTPSAMFFQPRGFSDHTRRITGVAGAGVSRRGHRTTTQKVHRYANMVLSSEAQSFPLLLCSANSAFAIWSYGMGLQRWDCALCLRDSATSPEDFNTGRMEFGRGTRIGAVGVVRRGDSLELTPRVGMQ